MNSNADGPPTKLNPDHRRWLIGIAITVAFGLFSAAMAWLNYAERTKDLPPQQRPSAPAAGAVGGPAPAAPAGDPAPRDRGNGNGKGRGKD